MQPLDLSTIDLDQEIDMAGPTVWQMLRLITRTREERKQPIKHLLEGPPLLVKSFYIMCCLFFTTDNR